MSGSAHLPDEKVARSYRRAFYVPVPFDLATEPYAGVSVRRANLTACCRLNVKVNEYYRVGQT
jgi:hypothetical protein